MEVAELDNEVCDVFLRLLSLRPYQLILSEKIFDYC